MKVKLVIYFGEEIWEEAVLNDDGSWATSSGDVLSGTELLAEAYHKSKEAE